MLLAMRWEVQGRTPSTAQPEVHVEVLQQRTCCLVNLAVLIGFVCSLQREKFELDIWGRRRRAWHL